MTGDNNFSSVNADQRTISLGSVTPDGSKLYFVNQSSGGDIVLPTGFYRLTLFYKGGFLNLKKIVCDTKDFGVGDVYFVGGQSNAAGHGGAAMTGLGGADYNLAQNLDNAISTTGSADFSPLVRVYANREHENNADGNFTSSQKIVKYGVPYKGYSFDKNPSPNIFDGLAVKSGFEIFKNGSESNPDANRIPMYPNGYNSWCWAPLGYKLATNNGLVNKYQGTPTMWFNSAASGTSMVDVNFPNPGGFSYNAWGRDYYSASTPENTQSLATKFSNTIRNYAGAFGAKAVLWCQGENDTFGISTGDLNTDNQILDGYQSTLNQLINFSREAATGLALGGTTPNPPLAHNDLNWFVAKTTANPKWNTGTTANPIWNIGSNGYSFLNEITITSNNDGTESSQIRNKQTINPSDRIFEGVNTDLLVTGKRASQANVHFTGGSLNDLAYEWYLKIKNVSGTGFVPPAQLLSLSSVTGGNGSYILTVNNTEGASHFFWQKNNDAIMRYPNSFTSALPNESTSNVSPSGVFTGVLPGDVLHCYAFKNGRFLPVVPYIVPGTTQTAKILDTESSSINLNPTGSAISTGLIIQNVDWEIDSKPTWINDAYDEDNNRLVFSAGASSNTRSGNVILKDLGSALTKTITITQSGSTSITTSLTSLNPTSSSGSYRLNKSADNNTLQIAGTQYTQGIGVHANSSLTYNLGGQYDTFNFKIGQDDESNCGDGVQFSIKADGVTIYGPVTKTYGQAATAQSVSVSGKNTLELIVNMGANDYCDHGDWADVYLQSGSGGCGTPPIAPTSVSASPSSISSGGSSTLSASCAYGTVTWSTGATGSSISVSPGVTTNYTVKCVSVGCPDSPVVGVTVNVSNSPCVTVTNNLTMGSWNVNGHLLVARYFNSQYWLTQRIGTNPEKFLVRGSNMLTRGDVTLNNGSYSGLTTCFAWQNSDYGGLAVPNSTQFPTPAGFTLDYETDGTPFYTANGSCGLTAPTSVSASPASISSGQSSTLSATCATGTRLWSTGATSATIVVSPTSTTTYTVKCTQSGCPDSPTSSVTVQVGPCASLSHNLVMGTWNVTGHQLVAKYYHNQWWLVQRIATNPEKFLVRGSEMLTRGDVTLTNGSYSSLVGCFGWTYSAYNGLGTPNSTQFPTPSGWQYGTEPDGTPFYTSTGGGRIAADQDFINENVPSFISVYPNPSQGTFKIKVYLETASSLDIDLINSSGKVYQSIKAEGKEGQNEIPFTMQNISGGNYLIRVKTKDKVESTVVVIR